MDRTAHIVGTATTPMQRRDLTIEDMAHQVVDHALSDAGMTPDEVDLVIFGNATAGRLLNQACIRGQSFLLDAGLRNAGIINVDNSCAGGASALHLATLSTLGGAGTVLAVGVEKMWTGDRAGDPGRHRGRGARGRPGLHARQLGEPVGLGADGPQRQVDGRAHGGVGHDPRADRRGRGQGPQARGPQPPRPVPERGDPGRGARPPRPSSPRSPGSCARRSPTVPPPWCCRSPSRRRRGAQDPVEHGPLGERRHRLPRAVGGDGVGGVGRIGSRPRRRRRGRAARRHQRRGDLRPRSRSASTSPGTPVRRHWPGTPPSAAGA